MLQNTMRLTLKYQQVDLTKLNVFISYSSKDIDAAGLIESGLKRMGFQVMLIRTEESSYGEKSNIRHQLSNIISDMDYVCVLVSNNSEKSDWIRYEVKQAMQLTGRVILILLNPDCESAVPAIVDNQNPDESDYPVLRHLKWTIVHFPDDSGDFGFLADMIINDPDEGQFLTETSQAVFANRDLHKECRLRRFARMWVGAHPSYVGQYVMEVLPFIWEEIGVDLGDSQAAFEWLVSTRGRADLVNSFKNNHIKLKCHSFDLQDREFNKLFGHASAGTFVVVAIPPYPFSHQAELQKYEIRMPTSKLTKGTASRINSSKYMYENSKERNSIASSNINVRSSQENEFSTLPKVPFEWIDIPRSKWNVPCSDKIASLPLWGVVAFGTRCAKRAMPLFGLLWPDSPKRYIKAVQEAVAIAECISSDSQSPALAEIHQTLKNVMLAVEASRTSQYIRSALVADAALHMLESAKAATEGRTSDAFKLSVQTVKKAYNAMEFNCEAKRRLCSDFELIYEKALQEQWTDQTHVAPEIFAEMWPEGEPATWNSDTGGE